MSPPGGAAAPHRNAAPLPSWLTVTDTPAPRGGQVIDGRICVVRTGLFDEFARALGLPAHFGRNWDALADCLREAAGASIAVEHADELLAQAPDLMATLLDVIGTLPPPGVRLDLHVPPGTGPRISVAVAALPLQSG